MQWNGFTLKKIYKCGQNMLSNKLKCQMILLYIQINNLMEIYAFMSIIDQGVENNKHIFFKNEWMSQYIQYTSPSQIWTIAIKSHINMSCNCANLIKKCTISSSGIITSKPINVSTLVNKHKLDLAKSILGASNIIFMKWMWYSNNIFDTMDIHLVFKFHKILLPFVSMIFYQFGKFQISLGAMVEINIDTLQKNLNSKNQK